MAKKVKTICYYISGHGYGHAARACQVMAALPGNVKIIVRTAVDPTFISRESGRKVEVVPGQFDTGVVQKNNLTLDWPATFRLAEKLNRETSANLMDETAFLRRRKVDVVVCDVAPAPLEAARMAGLPSVVVGNFTWVEIFDKERNNFPKAGKLADMWREQYGIATLAIRTPPAFPMKYFRRVETVEPIARRGKNIRGQILKELDLTKNTKLVLLYFGTFGDDELKVPEIDGMQFLAFTKMPGRVEKLDATKWSFPDVVASVDCVIAKPGYGTIGEAMANGTPVVYHPRPEFAEYPVLRKGLQDWGGAVQLSRDALVAGRWKPALQKAWALTPKKVRSHGAEQAAKVIMELVD